MDPEVKKYFLKILNSFAMGLLWLLSISTAGFYFNLAVPVGSVQWYNLLFYFLFLLSLTGILWYYFRVWRDQF